MARTTSIPTRAMDPAILERTRRVQRFPSRRAVLSARQERVRTRSRRTGSSPRLNTAAGSETTWSARSRPTDRGTYLFTMLIWLLTM
jgi:hypothetical protein